MNTKSIFIIILSIIVSLSCVGQANDVIIDSLLNDAYQQRKTCSECAINSAEKILHLCKESSCLPKQVSAAYRQIGIAKRYQKHFTEAIENYRKAFRIDSISGDKLEQVASLNLIGNIYKAQRKYDKAVEVYIRSLKIGETIDDSDELGDTYNSLGSIFSIRKEFDEAKEYFDKALVVRKEQDDKMRLASIYQDLGSFYGRMDSLNTALKNYFKSVDINKAINNKDALGQIYNNIGGIYLKKGDNKNAIKYFEKSLSIKKDQSNSRGVAVTTYNICELYYNEKKYERAISYCDESIVYATPLKDYRVLNNAEFILYQIAKVRNKPGKALTHHEAYTAWNDSLNKKKVDKEIQEIISKYEKDKKVATLEEKNRQQKNLLTTGIFSALIIVLGFFFYSRSEKKLRKETEGRRIEEQKLYKQVIKTLEKDAEIQAVNAEIDARQKERTKVASLLHDSVCGGLVSAKMHMESVRSNITPEDKAAFARGFGLIDEAYEICREISHDLSPPMLAKFGLAPAVEDLCEKLTTPQTQLHFNGILSEERLDHQQELTLYQSIQELLQNILKHSSAAEAHVQLTDYGDSLNILVEDDGKGFDTAAIADGGIGLQRISTRVKHLGGSMDVDSSPGNGTTVIIDVPKLLTSENGSIS